MLIVVALGGNALQRPGDPPSAAAHKRNLERAAQAVAALAAEHDVVVTHGNGPQVGLLALQSESLPGVPRTPLDQLGAESEGLIGYMIERELKAVLPDQDLVTLLTMVEVDMADPAFADPTKPIGPVQSAAEADRLAAELGWTFIPVDGGYRRVVPSPAPLRILQLDTIELLVDKDVMVICGGGGGIPVTVTNEGALRGVEAVIDKDRAAGLLAAELDADALLMLTDIDAVYEGFGTDSEKAIAELTPEGADWLKLDPGTMGPKVEAARDFVLRTGGVAGIGALKDAAAILEGEVGTLVRAED